MPHLSSAPHLCPSFHTQGSQSPPPSYLTSQLLSPLPFTPYNSTCCALSRLDRHPTPQAHGISPKPKKHPNVSVEGLGRKGSRSSLVLSWVDPIGIEMVSHTPLQPCLQVGGGLRRRGDRGTQCPSFWYPSPLPVTNRPVPSFWRGQYPWGTSLEWVLEERNHPEADSRIEESGGLCLETDSPRPWERRWTHLAPGRRRGRLGL